MEVKIEGGSINLVEILLQGAEIWNEWRMQNLEEFLDLRGADLSGADLRGALLGGALLNDADLTGADLANADLIEADLSGANLAFAHIYRASLYGANLHGTLLIRANLTSANLIHANLSDTDLRGANLSDTDLRGANLTEANLQGSNLNHAKLSDADLSYSIFGGTILGNLDFGEVIGLETITHSTSSLLSFDTIYRSQVELIPNFLIGCGIRPEDLPLINRLSRSPRSDVFNLRSKEFKNYQTKVNYSIEDAVNESWERNEQVQPQEILRLMITEEPLTSSNFSKILSALTQLHTKCWLVQQNRLADLVTYTQTYNQQFEKEANLVINQLSKNSPTKFEFPVDKLTTAISDSIVSLSTLDLKKQELTLDNELKALENRKFEQKAEFENRRDAQELDFDRQRAEFEFEKEKFALQREQFELEKVKMALETERFAAVTKQAAILIDTCQPNLGADARAMAIATLVGNMLQLDQAQGLEVILPQLMPRSEE